MEYWFYAHKKSYIQSEHTTTLQQQHISIERVILLTGNALPCLANFSARVDDRISDMAFINNKNWFFPLVYNDNDDDDDF